MSVRQLPQALLARDEIVEAPVAIAPSWQDYRFELPTGIYAAMAVLFLGFVATLTMAVGDVAMAVPFGVIVAFIAAFFAVPVIMTRAAPDGCARSMCWSDLMDNGIALADGKCGGGEAAVLALLLPIVIFGWSLAIAVIVATL